MYVKLEKPLYGTLQSTMLLCRLKTEKLVSMGFEFNLYNEYVSNKIIEGRQFTILWHVDDIKVTDVDSKVVFEVPGELEKEDGKDAPLTVSCGKRHT